MGRGSTPHVGVYTPKRRLSAALLYAGSDDSFQWQSHRLVAHRKNHPVALMAPVSRPACFHPRHASTPKFDQAPGKGGCPAADQIGCMPAWFLRKHPRAIGRRFFATLFKVV